ncbi:MAG TPA: glycosyltransferase [[Clostridium] spiroforme]|uniref:Glycosyltransferase n=1 Tax=Thomasclavelia spiroformis TaxID=29348 RepID=A0A921G9V9_9FIRM|nr:glycosyltransferase [Thomasclavelia spiroformis]
MKILYFLSGTGVGGIGKFVKDIVSHMPAEVNFTFVTLGNPNSDLSLFLKEHGKVLNYPRWGRKVLRGLKNELKVNHYDIVHAHLGCWSFICLYFAMRAGVKRRIAHSHSADNFKTLNKTGKLIFLISRIANPLVVTDYMACSDHACAETFGKKVLKMDRYYRVLNPVDERYFEKATHDVREELEIPKSSRVVCHVGYMGYHKNHLFILELAEELKDEDVYWLLVGDGHFRKQFEVAASEKHLDKVIFLGIRNDVPDILKASNLFILPSLLEGLGTVVLEAQACGLPCIISENVTEETDMGLGLVKKIPLYAKREWKNEILLNNIKIHTDIIKQKFVNEKVEINSCSKNLLKIYTIK